MATKRDAIEKLMRHDLNYELGIPTISDLEYDVLKAETKSKYPNDPYFKTVGSSAIKSERDIKLPFVMGSLDKVKTDTVQTWVKGKGYITASEKVDGVSIMCTWEKGKPVFLATRGDGNTGQDITPKAKYFIPDIDIQDKLTLRADATFLDDDYLTFGYSNRRNGTAGVLNDKKINVEALKKIKPIFYEIIDSPYIPKEEYERFIYIRSLGLKTPDFTLITLADMPRLIDILVNMIKNGKKNKNYDIDGLVLSVNLSNRENVLFPVNKIAFKIQGEEVKAIVDTIKWQVSRFGRIKPVINIKPVRIGGVNIRNVSGHNASYIFENNIGKDTELRIIRSGDVIPYITEIKKSTKALLPKKCPSCSGTLKFIGEELICNSMYCDDTSTKRVAWFIKTIGVKGFTEKTLSKYNVTSLDDLLDLNMLERKMGWRAYHRLVTALTDTFNSLDASKLLASFGIRGIGVKVAKEICDKLGIKTIHDFTYNIFGKPITVDIGEKTLQSLNAEIGKYYRFYKDLCSRYIIRLSNNESNNTLVGKTFVITGTLPVRREDAVLLIERNGGHLSNTVSTRTTELIADSPSSHSKYQKATQLNIPIISWRNFRLKYNV